LLTLLFLQKDIAVDDEKHHVIIDPVEAHCLYLSGAQLLQGVGLGSHNEGQFKGGPFDLALLKRLPQKHQPTPLMGVTLDGVAWPIPTPALVWQQQGGWLSDRLIAYEQGHQPQGPTRGSPA